MEPCNPNVLIMINAHSKWIEAEVQTPVLIFCWHFPEGTLQQIKDQNLLLQMQTHDRWGL